MKVLNPFSQGTDMSIFNTPCKESGKCVAKSDAMSEGQICSKEKKQNNSLCLYRVIF